jgi:ppGpp synthetase/RelA/SpoT-type nucleotidyltranferase
VNAAARHLVEWDTATEYESGLYLRYETALPIINNWRASHSFPLNTFRINLNRSARNADPERLTAQRIKRLSSISSKLQRFPQMKLTQMQDIGGCRAVLRSVDRVKMLADAYKASGVKHKIVHTDNYIETPAASGYRGIHLIWRYHSDRSSDYNDLKIEMQLRSGLQHAWATAVETVGTFLRQALKSSLGEAQWLRFFVLMGSVVAFKEGTPAVPGTPSDYKELVDELSHYAVMLDVENRLTTFSSALRVLETPSAPDAAYFLLEIDPSTEQLKITGFKSRDLEFAAAKYLEAEKDIPKDNSRDAVLVSVESMASLRRAYPNYFADTHVFAALVRETLEQHALV